MISHQCPEVIRQVLAMAPLSMQTQRLNVAKAELIFSPSDARFIQTPQGCRSSRHSMLHNQTAQLV